MAFASIAFIIPQYDKSKFKNWWLKAYIPGTTTPKVMATDSTGAVTSAKFEINSEGFPVTSGGALVIPFIDGRYDLWLFPTEAEADANNTSNASQFADNILAGVIGDAVKSFDVLSDAVSEISIVDGDALQIKERTSSNGGGADWNVVLASSVVIDGKAFVQCTGVPTLALVLDTGDKFPDLLQLGAIGSVLINDTETIQYSVDNYNAVDFADKIYGCGQIEYKSNTSIKGTGQQRSGFFRLVAGDTLVTDTDNITETVEFRDFQINGNGLSGDGLVMDRVKYSNFFNLFIFACVGSGVAVGSTNVDGSFYNNFYGLHSTDNSHGVRLKDYANATNFMGGRINGNIDKGFFIENTVNKPNGGSVSFMAIEGNGGWGIDYSGNLMTFFGNRIEQNGAGGARLNADGQSPTFVGNSYHTQPNPLVNNIPEGSFSPTLQDLQNGIKLNIMSEINGFSNALKIKGIQGLSGTAVQSKNLVVPDNAVTETSTSVNIPLPNEEDDTDYFVWAMPNWFTTVAQGTKTKTTAGLQFGTAAPANAKVTILIMR